ncbi:conserved domain protein [delta proteobacterium NaphS2]|nr:conserved domain protein [delta proteobacterium NaphS2]
MRNHGKQKKQFEQKGVGQSLSGVDYQRPGGFGSTVRPMRRSIYPSCRRHEERRMRSIWLFALFPKS